MNRRTCTTLKIRSTPTDGESKSQMEEWKPELVNDQFQLTAVLKENRNIAVHNSAKRSSSSNPEPPLPLDLPNFSQEREKNGQHVPPSHTSDVTIKRCTNCTRCTSALKVNKIKK